MILDGGRLEAPVPSTLSVAGQRLSQRLQEQRPRSIVASPDGLRLAFRRGDDDTTTVWSATGESTTFLAAKVYQLWFAGSEFLAAPAEHGPVDALWHVGDDAKRIELPEPVFDINVDAARRFAAVTAGALLIGEIDAERGEVRIAQRINLPEIHRTGVRYVFVVGGDDVVVVSTVSSGTPGVGGRRLATFRFSTGERLDEIVDSATNRDHRLDEDEFLVASLVDKAVIRQRLRVADGGRLTLEEEPVRHRGYVESVSPGGAWIECRLPGGLITWGPSYEVVALHGTRTTAKRGVRGPVMGWIAVSDQDAWDEND